MTTSDKHFRTGFCSKSPAAQTTDSSGVSIYTLKYKLMLSVIWGDWDKT